MMAWPLALHVVVVLVLVTAMLAVPHVLGERHRERATEEPYESGIVSSGSARVRLSADFYLVGLLFVIFDLEVAFLFAWAVAAQPLGVTGYVAFLVFTAILVVGLLYEWSQGALDWGWSAEAADRARRARESSERTRRERVAS